MSRVLIFGLPRSGTTSLIRGILDQGYHAIIEPYNGGLQNAVEREYPIKDFDSHKNIVVKNLINQKPSSWTKGWKQFEIEFMLNFDKFIFLDRRDFSSHLTSVVNLWWKVFNETSTMQAWSDEELPIDFYNGFVMGGGETRLHIDKENFRDFLIETGHGGRITYYEDLYGSDRNKSLDLIKSWELDNIDCDRLNEYLHPSKKLYRGSKKAAI